MNTHPGHGTTKCFDCQRVIRTCRRMHSEKFVSWQLCDSCIEKRDGLRTAVPYSPNPPDPVATDHVVIEPPLSFACLHCGERVRFVPPVSVNTMSVLAETFIGLHRGCAKPTGETP